MLDWDNYLQRYFHVTFNNPTQTKQKKTKKTTNKQKTEETCDISSLAITIDADTRAQCMHTSEFIQSSRYLLG